MDRSAIRSLFQQFAAPLEKYVVLGARREAVTELARNLWAALIAGPQAEQQVWDALQQSGDAPAALFDLIRTCYLDEMKPVVRREELAALRQHYGMRPAEPSEPGGL